MPAWKSIVENAEKRNDYIAVRGHGGFVRGKWDEITEIIAAANAAVTTPHHSWPSRIG